MPKHAAAAHIVAAIATPAPSATPTPRLRPAAARLAELLGQPVQMLDDCVGPAVEAAVKALKPGGVALLENLRFHDEEEENDPAFARQLAALGDLYVNDAFSASHRAHSSIEALAHLLPAYAGLLMEDELNALSAGLENPKRPVAAGRQGGWRPLNCRSSPRVGPARTAQRPSAPLS